MSANRYVAGKDFRLSIGSGGFLQCISCSKEHTVGEFDCTNNEGAINADNGALQAEHDYDVDEQTIQATIVVKKSAYPSLVPGTFYDNSFYAEKFPGSTYTGSFGLSKVTKKGQVRGAYQVDIQGKFSGAVVRSATAAPSS